LLLQIKLDI